jgi:HK97 family phage major capsid protein
MSKLSKLLARLRAKREDVPVEEVVAVIDEASTEVVVTIDGLLAQMDELLTTPPEDAAAWSQAVATLREQLAMLVPAVEDITDAVEEIDATEEPAAEQSAERARKVRKALKAASERLDALTARRQEKMELRALQSNNAAAASALRAGNGAPSMRGYGANGSHHARPKRSKHFDTDQRAFEFGRMIAAQLGSMEAQEYVRSRGLMTRTMSSSDVASAGLLIPDDIESVILKFRDERGVARRICDVRQMTTATKTIRKQVSGPTHQYIGEGSTIDTSQGIRYVDHTLTAKWVAVATEMYATLDEDASVSLADEFVEFAGYQLAGAEDAAFFAGNGLSATGGIMGMFRLFQKLVEDAGGTWATDAHKLYHPGVRLTTGNTFASATLAEITGLGASVASRQGIQKSIVCSPETYFDILLPKAYTANGATGTEIVNGLATQVWNGIPVVLTDFAPTATATNTAFILYGDPRSYVIGDRRGITVEFDKDIKTQVIQAVVTARYDGAGIDFGVASATAANRQKGGLGALVTKN